MKFRDDGALWWLCFEKDEPLRQTLECFLKETDCSGGAITGIGAALDPLLGYFSLATNAHDQQQFRGFYEITSMNGSVTLAEDGTPGFHLHGTFADERCHLIGGHIHDLTVGLTLEMVIYRSVWSLRRKTDKVTGVQLLDLSRCNL